MTFLSLAPWQAWLLLGLTATAVVVIFFLKVQHRRVVVGSDLIWRRVLERRKRRSWLEILRRLLSLLIALLIALSLAAAIGEPEWGGGEPRHLVLVMDTRLPMAATGPDGRSRWELAVARASEVLEWGSAADTFVIADTRGRIVAVPGRDRTAAREAIRSMRPDHVGFELPPLDPGAEVMLFTDGVGLGRVPQGVATVSAFTPVANVAVTAFETRPLPVDPLRHEAFLEVANYGDEPREVTVELEDDRRTLFRRRIELGAGQLYRNTFDLEPLPGGAPLRARAVSDGDGLAADDVAWVHLPRQRPVRLLMVGEGGDRLAEVLATEEHVELTRIGAADWEEGLAAGHDGLVLYGFAPGRSPAVPTLLVDPPAVDWLPTSSGSASELRVDTTAEHPLLRFVALEDVEVARARRFATAEARVLAASGDVPLIMVAEDPAPWVLWAFDPEDSDLPQSVGFPILVSNVLDWLRNDPEPLRRRPGTVEVPLPDAVVTSPAGARVAARHLAGSTFFDAPEPGLYWARMGRLAVPVAVNAGSREVSALNRTALASASEVELPEVARGRILWPSLVLLALALLLVEGITVHRRITV